MQPRAVSRPVPSRARHSRAVGLSLVGALLLSALGLAVGVSPAAALSTFAVNEVTDGPAIAGAEVDVTLIVDPGATPSRCRAGRRPPSSSVMPPTRPPSRS